MSLIASFLETVSDLFLSNREEMRSIMETRRILEEYLSKTPSSFANKAPREEARKVLKDLPKKNRLLFRMTAIVHDSLTPADLRSESRLEIDRETHRLYAIQESYKRLLALL